MNSDAIKIREEQSSHFVKRCNWFVIAGCLALLVWDLTSGVNSKPYITLLALGMLMGALSNLVEWEYLSGPNRQGPIAARIYCWGAFAFQFVVLFLLLANLGGFVRLPHIFH